MWSAPLYGSCPDAPPPEPVEVRGSFYEPVDELDGGQSWLMPPARAARVACLMQTCETNRAALEAGPDPTPLGLLIAVSVGMAIGFAGGVALVLQLR